MKKISKSKSRVETLKAIERVILRQDVLDTEKYTSALRKPESAIQDDIFIALEKKLPGIVSKYFKIEKSAAEKLILEKFAFESKKSTVVKNRPFLGTQHRPDATLDLGEMFSIAIEIKKGDSGSAVRSGIGQSVVYSALFDFVLYFFLDSSRGKDIKNDVDAEPSKTLLDSLWKNYNIRFFVR